MTVLRNPSPFPQSPMTRAESLRKQLEASKFEMEFGEVSQRIAWVNDEGELMLRSDTTTAFSAEQLRAFRTWLGYWFDEGGA